jgi:hypothetical protein
MTRMTRTAVKVAVAMLAIVMVGGCDDAAPLEVGTPDAMFDARMVSDFDAEASLTLETDAIADDGTETVDAWVCVAGVCGWMKATRDGNTLTVSLPADPSLLGMKVTAVVPGVGTFTGTYKL